MYNSEKLKGLFTRVYHDEMINDDKKGLYDEKDIKEYITRVFGDGSSSINPNALWQFNEVVVRTADEVAKPMVTDMLNLFADFTNRPSGQLVEIKIPKKNKAKVIWSAHGSGVDLVRVAGRDSKIATPEKFSTGFYYEPLDLVNDSVESFRTLVNDIANAKARLYLDQIYELVESAVQTSQIPAANVVTGSGLNLTDYNKLASVLQRYGGRPLFLADTLLIDHFALMQGTDDVYKNFVFEGLKEELLTSLNPTTIGRTHALNLVNPFTDETNTKTELPVNKGYMFAGSLNQKPFTVVEYGNMKQFTETHPEDERVKMKLTQEAAIEFLFGEAIGVVEDESVML